MGLFNKKEEVPEIPIAPTLPELPKPETQPEKKGLPELPSFPGNPRNEDINQEIVKSAVADVPSSEANELHVEIPEGLQVTEEQPESSAIPPVPSSQETIPSPPVISPLGESIPPIPGEPSISDIPKKIPELNTPIPNKPVTKQVEPIFVRIDKFQSAQKNFEHIKVKVKEIESVLKKIKDVKSREEDELKGWTEDVEKIKVRLAEIDADIFDQI